jgi:hypothetical protein
MRGSGLRVDTRPDAPKTNMIPMSLDARSQGYMPGAENLANHNGHHHPSSFSQYQRQTSQTQAAMNYYSQHPSLPAPQPSLQTVRADVMSNRNAQRHPVPVSQYHQYLAQFEAATKPHGQGPSPPGPAPQTSMGQWVRNMPKAHPAYAVRHGNQYTDPNAQSRQPTPNHLVHGHNPPENHGCPLINRSNSSGSRLGRPSAGANQPTKSAQVHRAAGPAQNMNSDPKGLHVHRAASVTGATSAMDMGGERQAMTAGLKRLEMLERNLAYLQKEHAARLSALERKHEEEVVASRTNELSRYRDVHGLPSTAFRKEIAALAAPEVGQAHISIESSSLSREKRSHQVDGMVAIPLTRTDKPNTPSQDIDIVRNIIEPQSDVNNKNVTPCHKLQVRRASKVSVENVRQRSNGESPKPPAGRYNMRKRVKKTVKRGR